MKRRLVALLVAGLGAGPLLAQVIANSSFEGGSLAGWTIGGTNRVDTLQASHVVGGTIAGGIPDGTWFAALSTTPSQTTAGGTTALIDGNTTNENDIASLAITVTIPFWPAVLEFDWTFPSSEQDQSDQFDDLFDVMIYQGVAPADPTINNRVFARSAARNTNTDFSNFTNAHTLGTTVVNWSINRAGSPVNATSLRYGVAGFRRACVGIDLPEFPGPPYTRTIRFRAADQGDRQFDSALFIDRVQVLPACAPAPQLNLVQRTSTTGNNVSLKTGGVQFRPVLGRRLAADPSGRVQALASNANLDGSNPSFVEQVFLRIDEAGWQRVTGLAMSDSGEVQALAVSGTVGATPGRYVAIAARLTETDNTEIYRWDRQASTLTTLTTTSACDNTNPSINFAGTVIAYETTCNVLTGDGTARKLMIWSGGAVNTGNEFLPAGSCLGRNPVLNTRSDQDGAYLVYESTCNPTTGNGDGNVEIFRYRNSGAAGTRFAQITTTVAPVINASPQMDRRQDGRNVFFLSNLHDTTRLLQVFYVSCGNADCSSGNVRTQWTDGPATQVYTSLRKLIRSADNTLIDDFMFERLNLSSGFTEVGHRIGQSGQESALTLAQPILQLSGGLDGTTPVFAFLSNLDLLTGQNADGNAEVFRGRVQP